MEAHGEAGPGDAASPRPARPHATLRPGHSRPPARLPPQARCADQSTAFPWVTVLTPGAGKRLGSFWEVSGAEREKRAGSLLPSPRSPPPRQKQTRPKPAGGCPRQEGLRAPPLLCPHRQTLQTRGSPPWPPPQRTPIPVLSLAKVSGCCFRLSCLWPGPQGTWRSEGAFDDSPHLRASVPWPPSLCFLMSLRRAEESKCRRWDGGASHGGRGDGGACPKPKMPRQVRQSAARLGTRR